MSTSTGTSVQFSRISRDPNQTRILRLSITYTLAIYIAYSIDRPLAFLTPVLATVLLCMPVPGPDLLSLLRQMRDTLVGVAAGAVLAIFLLPYPLVFLPILGLGLFYSYYLINRGGSFWLALMLLVSLLMMPLLRTQHQQLALGVLFEFVVFAWLAVGLFYLAHIVLPDSDKTEATKKKPPVLEYSPVAALASLKSTLVVMPVAALFVSFEWVGQLLVLVFIAIFTISVEPEKGRRAAHNSIVSTLIGGIAAWFFYALLVAVPEFYFLILLSLLTVLLFARRIYSGASYAQYLSSSLTTLILLVNASMGEGQDFSAAFMTRLGLIVLAAVYVVLALRILGAFTYGDQMKAGQQTL